MSCGSPMPRGEQIAKPAERYPLGRSFFLPRVMGWNSSRCRTHQAVAGSILSRSPPCELSASVSALFRWPWARRSSRCDSSRHMTSRRLMTLQVVVPPPQKLGAVPHGTRVIAPITSGTFEGPRLRGTLETDDGALISMTSFGLRHGPPEVLAALARGESVDPSTYYFRTAPRFETSAPQYEFLNRLIAIASGDRRATGPIYTIDEIL